MSYRAVVTDNFKREAKPLSKKYPSLKSDLRNLTDSLLENPEQGTSLGKGFRKVRMAITSKGQGKSGGARVIINVRVTAETIYFSSIYDKSEQDTVSYTEISAFLEEITDLEQEDTNDN
jgi:hypothetical protein